MKMKTGKVINLLDEGRTCALTEFQRGRVHALAGIGNPERFFTSLRSVLGRVETHAFPDHYRFRRNDILFDDEAPVLMTAKDAVKCRRFATGNEWYVPVTVELGRDFCARLDVLLRERIPRTPVAGTAA
jgi:tetraacyldisaccharide 4'-kinase